MNRDWTHRQLTAAKNALKRASRHAELALERRDSGDAEAELRTLWALAEIDLAERDLRRATKRLAVGKLPRSRRDRKDER